MIDKTKSEQVEYKIPEKKDAHIEVEYMKGVVIYKGVRIDLKNWVENEEIRYKNRLVKTVKTELESPPELAGLCIIVLGHVAGCGVPHGFAEPIISYEHRKELSDLIKKNYSAKVIFHINPNQSIKWFKF